MKKRLNNQPSYQEKVFDALIGGVGKIVGLVRISPKSSRPIKSIDRLEITTRWRQIEQSHRLGGSSGLKQAVIEADNLLDKALRMKVSGQTMGERLINAQSLISSQAYQAAWEGHKLRNRIVHQDQSEVLSFETEQALKGFKQALLELGGL